MAVGTWELVFVLLIARASPSRAGFIQLPQQSDAWTAFYSLQENDCNGAGRFRQFPHIYGLENDAEVSIGAPTNMTTTYLQRRYFSFRPELYPGILVEFDPPEHGLDHLKGYEIMLRKPNGTLCIVLDLVDNAATLREKVKMDVYPLSSKTYFRVTVASLPLYNEAQVTEEDRILTGVDGVPPEPFDWSAAKIVYNVTRHGDDRWLDVIFTSPPPQFRFRRFEVALLPADNSDTGIRSVTTETCFYTFRNVTLGQYKLQIRPVDDYFSVQGRCLCHYRSGTCTTCFTTEVQALTVS